MSSAGPSVLDDPRWHAFNKDGFQCSCGERHVGLFPINMLTPAGWQGSKDYEPDEALRTDGSFISQNYCVFEGKAFAIRMRLPIRIRGAEPAAFMYTVWGGVDRQQFETYVAEQKSGAIRDGAQTPATLVNRLAGYDDTNHLTGMMFQQTDGFQPALLLVGPQHYNNSDHRLIREQKEGIDLDRALELFAAYGHEMRTNLSGAN